MYYLFKMQLIIAIMQLFGKREDGIIHQYYLIQIHRRHVFVCLSLLIEHTGVSRICISRANQRGTILGQKCDIGYVIHEHIGFKH